MKLKEFKKWLEENGYRTNTINSRLSNIKTIEDSYGDLDALMLKDGCRSIINELNYTTDDEYFNRAPRHKILINGNIRNGAATYKQALKLYQQFYEYNLNNKTIYNTEFEKEANIIFDKISNFEHSLLKKKKLTRQEIGIIQSDLLKYLSDKLPHIHWEEEKIYDEINKIRDRVDIIGNIDENHCIIVELDPPRADSISKKFVSRVALYSEMNLIYVTACYPNNNVENIKECNKYFNYCDSIIRGLRDTNLEKYYKGIYLGKKVL